MFDLCAVGTCDRNAALVPAHVRAIILIAQIKCPVSLGVQLRLREAIAEVGEAVPGILEVPVIKSRLLDGFEVMEGASCPGGDDLAVPPIPGTAVRVPHSALHVYIAVLSEIADRL